ncbi:ABC transporter permease [Pseudoglutamicibacter albus]|uniref:ABC transporter permease n=1 Tax=Pseudoglutamicibacter albus TaxID=98671 RepID=UPI001EF575F7|nr:ABC transporter permease [Pseudoglutamicibacter albus]
MSSPWPRAVRSVIRKPRRSILMTLIMAVVFTALVAQSGVRSSMAEVKNAIGTNVGAGFTATAAAVPGTNPDAGNAPNTGNGTAQTPTELPADQAGIDESVLKRLAGLPQIAKHSVEAVTMPQLEGAKPVAGGRGVQLDPEFAGAVTATGVSDSELNPGFQGKLYQLVEGSHVGEGASQALIHREFAQLNNLKPGSTLALAQDTTKITVKVAGIFDGKTENPSGMPAGASENQVFLDLASARKLGAPLTTGRYFTHNAQELPQALKAAQHAAPELTLEDNSAQFTPVLQAIAGVDKLLAVLLLGLSIAGACVLTLVSTFWARGRIHEVGILLSLGKSKSNVLSQFGIEASIFAAVAATISTVAGTVLSGYLGRAIIAQAGEDALASIHLTASASGTVAALAWGFVIVLIGVSVGVLPLIIQRPKRILSKRS